MSVNNFKIKGLTSQEVLEAREKFGYNRFDYKKENGFIDAIIGLV